MCCCFCVCFCFSCLSCVFLVFECISCVFLYFSSFFLRYMLDFMVWCFLCVMFIQCVCLFSMCACLWCCFVCKLFFFLYMFRYVFVCVSIVSHVYPAFLRFKLFFFVHFNSRFCFTCVMFFCVFADHVYIVVSLYFYVLPFLCLLYWKLLFLFRMFILCACVS